MKICLISNLYPPCILGGAEIVVQKVAAELLKDGNEVFVITTSPDKEYKEEIDGVKVFRVNPLNLYPMYSHQEKSGLMKPLWHLMDIWNLSSYSTIKKILKEEKPDIVHVHNFKGLSLSVFSAPKDLKIPVVFTAHDCSLICPRANLLKGDNSACKEPKRICTFYAKLNEKILNNNIDWFIAPSNFIIDTLKSSNFFKNVETTKIPLGVNITGLNGEKTYDIIDISYMGNLNRSKGVHILINAFKHINDENIRLNLFGKGSDEEWYRELAANDKRIKFHGFISGEKLINAYKHANITVLPSICYDNSPMMIYESLMNGTPVIGSKIGGVPELVMEGKNGLLFNPGDEIELAKKIQYLLDNPERLKEMENGAFESVRKFSMENHMAELKKIYKSLIKEK